MAVSTFSFFFLLFFGCGGGEESDKLFFGQSSSSSGTTQICIPGASYPCYDGPLETMNIGQCRPGFKQCTETGLDYGWCQGEILPEQKEICDDLIDNNCNGIVDKDCMPSCNLDQDCKLENELCREGLCQEGYCSIINLPDSLQFNQIMGDCKKEKCDGNGNLISFNYNTDVPSIPCYTCTCSNGNPINTPLPEGTSCSVNGGQACDGVGACVECVGNFQCPAGQTCQGHKCL